MTESRRGFKKGFANIDELTGGRIYMIASPNDNHQEIMTFIYKA